MLKLDAKTVAALALGDKSDRIEFDRLLPGFGYRVRRAASGEVLRSWIAQYRLAGKQRRVLIGNADVVSAEQARIAARKILAKVQLGEDPQAERLDRRARDRFTFRNVLDRYLADKAGSVRPRTHGEMVRYLTGHYFEPLHAMAVDRIARRDVAERLLSIKTDSGVATAFSAKAALSAFFVWAMKMGLVDSNPVVGTESFEVPKRARVLSDQELAAVWNACNGGDDYDRIVRLLILSGCRRQEVGGMTFSELDRDTGKWTIPSARSKNGHAHTLPLPPLAWGIIDSVKPRDRDHLFGGAKGFQIWGRAKAELDARLGDAVSDWTLHDLRRAAATGLANLGVLPHVVEEVLNHKSGSKAGVAGIYNHAKYEREVRSALALWADHVQALALGAPRKIVPYSRRAS